MPSPEFLPNNAETLLDILRLRAVQHPSRVVYRFVTGNQKQVFTLTGQELKDESIQLANVLSQQTKVGDRVLLAYQDPLLFIRAFYACLWAGVIAVPVPPPQHNKKSARLRMILLHSEPCVILTQSNRMSDLTKILQANDLSTVPAVICTDTPAQLLPDTAELPIIHGSMLALLQYTSGTTGAPKGVVITHKNIMSNSAQLQIAMGYGPASRGVSWLPHYHDMGLMGAVIQPLYAGANVTLLSPTSFFADPFIWLQVMSDERATASGGPALAYDYCVKNITLAQTAQLDLSHWQVASIGADTVPAEIISAFGNKFKHCGFSQQVFYPSYGMAETTLFASGKDYRTAATLKSFDKKKLRQHCAVPLGSRIDTQQTTLLSVGYPRGDTGIAIVDPQSRKKLSENSVGEIWVKGSNVAQRYWRNPDLSEKMLNAYITETDDGPYLRSGDLGFISAGELYVTGRIDDLITIDYLHYYPHTLEWTATHAHHALADYGAAAFLLADNNALVITLEIKLSSRRGLQIVEVKSQVCCEIEREYALRVHDVVLVKPHQLPRTSSGKIQRFECKRQYMQDDMQDIRFT